jgi:hypothetical protein
MSDLRSHLHRYWVRFEEPTASLALGMGVTAVDRSDAETVLRASVLFAHREFPPILEMEEDVDVRELDRGHVLPNMGDPSVRGVWYPRA